MKETVIRWASEKPKVYLIIVAESVVIFLLAIAFCLYEFGIEKTYKLAGMLTPVAVMGVTVYFAWNQLELGRGQKALAQRQATTAHTKLKLDLFDKRYEAYQNIMEHFIYCYDLPMGINAYLCLTPQESIKYYHLKGVASNDVEKRNFIEPIRERAYEKITEIGEYNDESKKKRELDLERVRFLYSDEVYQVLFDFTKKSHELLGEQHRTLDLLLQKTVDEFISKNEWDIPSLEQIDRRKKGLARECKLNIVEALRPYLHVPDQ